MPSPFTPDQLASLSLQIDQQLAPLRDESAQSVQSMRNVRGLRILNTWMPVPSTGNAADKQDIPERLPMQWQAIAAVTKEEPRSFWRRFKQAAHCDLCEEGGVLHTQWKKYGDLSNEAVLKSFGTILAAMGFSGNVLQMLAVAAGVIVIHLGCTAICEEK
ncbi:MAG: hypothetical protein ACTFAL_07100 [Candidatus Electronema sp. V4]|uniref:hypothetical protein n=1 Tax=Candidatus Electronema sp. V4 TaxID=3454756 RepID=UPI00405584F2